MARVTQPTPYVPPRNNDEFDDQGPVYTQTDEDESGDEEQNGGVAQSAEVRRRRSPLERSIASLLRSPDTASPDDLIREVDAKFKELASMREEFGRHATVTERTVAYNEKLKKKLKALKRQLLEAALSVDDD